jgi:predicted HicB family RNase H-like nuclease
VKQIHLRKVPEDLHRKVKTAAAQAGKSMQDFILEAMATAVRGKKGELPVR